MVYYVVAISRHRRNTMSISSFASLDSKLERLVANHPMVSVQEGFCDRIRHGDIRLQYKARHGCTAIFSVTMVDGSPMRVLTIDPSAFASALKSDAWWTLVIFHESVHECQYRKGERDPQTFDPTYRPRDRTEWAHFAEEKWYAEREAYQKECWLAQRMGAQHELGGLCELAGTHRFDRQLARLLAANETNPIVRRTFSRLATSTQA